MDGGLLKKIKVIQNIIFTNFYAKLIKRYPLILDNVKEFDNRKAKKEPVKVTKNVNI
jgi:hypothetical protein